MDRYVRISFENLDTEQKEILIACLGDMGYEGFEEEPGKLMAYIGEPAFDADSLHSLTSGLSVSWQQELIEPRNWNQLWEENFQPVQVGDFCCVRASFHDPAPGCRFDIIITPKMSFGTGHHATTYMMMETMKELSFEGNSVLDFGTGTGVLAILAEKMGASLINAIDNDDWSIENAAENILLNQCYKIVLQKADRLSFPGRFNIILANINRNVLLARMDSIQQHLTPGGVVIMSGLLEGDKEIITGKAEAAGLVLKGKKSREGWISLQFSTR